MKKIELPKIAFLILCDNHDFGLTGKINCYGIFNIFNIWATPAQREGSIVLYAYNIYKNEKLSINWVEPNGKKIHMGDFNFSKSPNPHGYANMAIHAPFQINKNGIHILEAKLNEDIHHIPIIVHKENWPKLTEKQIKDALDDPNTIKSTRMEITCIKCNRTHIFEVHLDPNVRKTPGTYEFPKNGKFLCKTKSCKKTFYTRDIEGRARSLLGKKATKKMR